MIQNRLLYLIALAGAVTFFLFYNGWIAMALLIVVLALPILSLLFSLPYRPKNAEASLKLPERLVFFREEKGELLLSAPGDARKTNPLCFRVRLVRENRMNGVVLRDTAYLSAGRTRRFPLDTAHCGTTVCRITRCSALDFLGLFRFRVPMPLPCRVTVFPKPVPPEPLPDFSVFRVGTLRPKPGGGFSELHEMRAYRPGDPVKSIHWKLSAKRDELIIREPQEAPGLAAEVILATPDNRERLDAIFDEALWVAEELVERGIRGKIGWNGMESYPLEDEKTLETAFGELLETAVSDFPRRNDPLENPADGQIHITGERRGEAEA